MWDLVTSSGEVAEYPSLSKCIEEPTVVVMCHTKHEKPSQEQVFWFVLSGLL